MVKNYGEEDGIDISLNVFLSLTTLSILPVFTSYMKPWTDISGGKNVVDFILLT